MSISNIHPHAGVQKASELAALVNGVLHGDDKDIYHVAPLDKAGAQDVSFLENSNYKQQFLESNAGVCIIHPDFVSMRSKHMSLIAHEAPYYAYAKIAGALYPQTKTASIHPSAVIADNAVIGEKVSIGANAVIGEKVSIGADSIIHPNVTISHAVLGKNCVIYPNAAIGQAGFGYATYQGVHHPVPQLGRVVLKDNVEVGSNATIDRGSNQDTIIGEGTKIDNLVQIAHNVEIGKGCFIVAQVGVSGSTKIGNYCVFGGQVGVAGHLHIADGTQVAAQSGIVKSTDKGQKVGGTPAVSITDWHRQTIALKRLTKK